MHNSLPIQDPIAYYIRQKLTPDTDETLFLTDFIKEVYHKKYTNDYYGFRDFIIRNGFFDLPRKNEEEADEETSDLRLLFRHFDDYVEKTYYGTVGMFKAQERD